MWTILAAELRYQKHIILSLYLLLGLVMAALMSPGFFRSAAEPGQNAGFLVMFAMFLGLVFSLILNPAPKEQRLSFLVPLPLPIWQTALALGLAEVVSWLGYCLLLGAACLFLPEAFRGTPELLTALAAQTGLAFITISCGSLHFTHAWPAFRKQARAGIGKAMLLALMGLIWLQLYLLAFLQLIALRDCFLGRDQTLLFRLYQTPSMAAALLAAGLAMHLALAAGQARRRSFIPE